MKRFLLLLLVIFFSIEADASAQELYATNSSNVGVLYSVNDVNGEAEDLGNLGFRVFDLTADRRPSFEGLWAVTWQNGGLQLVELDPRNRSVVFSVELSATESIATLAIHPTTGAMFGTSATSGETSLFQIDRVSGSTTVVGDINTPLTSLAFDRDGRLFRSLGRRNAV